MEKTASQIQKERIKELEEKANALIQKCDVATLTSINEKGYPPYLCVEKDIEETEKALTNLFSAR